MKKNILLVCACLMLIGTFSCAKKSTCPAYNKEAVHDPFANMNKKKKKEKKNGLVDKKQPKSINKK